jgi:hypothetical protein
MSAITRFFFRTPTEFAPTTPWHIIQWWESRRLVYNAVVGAAGLVSLSCAAVFSIVMEGPANAGVPLGAIVFYGVLANIFYTAGPVLDLIVTRAWGNQYAPVGATLFRYGFAFSVGLTLLPIPVMMMAMIGKFLGVFS